MKPQAQPAISPSRLSESTHRQLNMYALAAGAAGVSLLALARSANAKVVYTETNEALRPRVPILIDLNHDGISDFQLRTTYYAGSSGFKVGVNASECRNLNNAIAGRHGNVPGSDYFFSAAFALPAAARIGPKRSFPVRRAVMAVELFKKDVGTSQYSELGPWVGTGKGMQNRYLGLKFVVDGQVHYGWARFSITLEHERQRGAAGGTLTGYAYETVPNKAIVAGETEGADVITVYEGTLGQLARGRK
jgi:hypothetical protein